MESSLSLTTSTSYLGNYIVDHLLDITRAINRNLSILSKKNEVCLSERDYNILHNVFTKLRHAVDDWLFANDRRALQLSLDDMVINILLASDTIRHLANSYNWRKFIFNLREIDVAEQTIKQIERKHQDYIEEHRKDPWALTRKWYRRISQGFQLICPQCKYTIRDLNLITEQLPDKSTRPGPR